ncbi:major tail protein [Bacillus inaquosorum]|uniref:UDP-N-acetylmuramoylalanine-D-glutamate ligase UDP-N-acetylmuramoyl-L-alanyl-D-glutamate synthetase n=1 Tax=Bacillus inaquosorum KCTC 13429 TaxID=1236548 RepID=A0A9W5LK05_9BACI|nr:major tail protein [Bacillus inaquosorum]AWM17816.1 major tail protein [Bacillus inaquosorum]ELS62185.1 UDP-N-acetylmuramoylalanine-D-glutamate ligase UDP-N-acetylmuramoyl-L-alanyl-D-glutamate synthetase [Bacillus inaquosorum KCTC 13429]
MAKTGLSGINYSELVDEKASKIESLPGAIEAKLDVSSELTPLYADDGIFAVKSTGVSETKLELNVADLTTEMKRTLLGVKVVDGIEEYHKDMEPPYVCITWRQKHHEKGYVYYALLKGKFGIPSVEGKTKEDKVDYQTDTIEGQFLPRKSDGLVFLIGYDQNDGFTLEKFYQRAYGMLPDGMTTEEVSADLGK